MKKKKKQYPEKNNILLNFLPGKKKYKKSLKGEIYSFLNFLLGKSYYLYKYTYLAKWSDDVSLRSVLDSQSLSHLRKSNYTNHITQHINYC